MPTINVLCKSLSLWKVACFVFMCPISVEWGGLGSQGKLPPMASASPSWGFYSFWGYSENGTCIGFYERTLCVDLFLHTPCSLTLFFPSLSQGPKITFNTEIISGKMIVGNVHCLLCVCGPPPPFVQREKWGYLVKGRKEDLRWLESRLIQDKS